ncbi:protein of unknown function [Candidatus Nitrosocosmicus franklandus]|uniref:Uncharacterized protein n=1 Tax=Candidatus Nitrosocosmicus franklandianus TaxID=1798806 RepID=A0A484ID39_9ARCH|nr:protein of unknown function [Candidatus Nitrosocosmicus franklandus]
MVSIISDFCLKANGFLTQRFESVNADKHSLGKNLQSLCFE